MAINQQQQENLFKGLGLFIEAFRPYLVTVLIQESGDRWPAKFVDSLSPDQKAKWNQGLKNGSQPEALIDFPHLKSFAIQNKTLLRHDFDRKGNDLPNWLGEIYEVRNKIAHFQEIDEDEATKAWIHMKSIATILKMDELETEIKWLREGKTVTPVTNNANNQTGLAPWFRVVSPHLDIKQGRLDESVFAANLAEVALGNGREIYSNPIVFFSKTYFTAGLKTVAKSVIKGLNGKEDADNRVISLQTGFGGGKTHTLISLYHICKWGKHSINSPATKELLSYTGAPEFDTANIAVFTNTTNDPANGRVTPDQITIQTIWGELAYQLGGKEAYEIVRKNDEQLIAPAGLFKQVLDKCKPALILIDELADYCVKASARKAGNSSLADQTISFMQELTEAVAGTNRAVLVVTLPASVQEVGNTTEAQSVLSSLQKRVSRVGADTQPVADDEIFEVIRRRLFEEVGNAASIEACASKYMEMYKQFSSELPQHVNKSEYKQRIIKSYPFHPELIDIFRIRWASHHDFQRTRGVLRLLAAIVSDLWLRQQSLPGANLLIYPGEVNFANLDALSGQLKKLYGTGYDAVISADVSGSSSNAFKIDSNKPEYGQWYLTQSVASVILLNSFGSDGANKGIGVPEIKLQLLQPDSFNHNSINGALDELESSAYYLYYTQTGSSNKRYWYHTKPNINILINQAKADIKNIDIEAEILKRIKDKTRFIQLFNTLVDPSDDIPEQMRPTLIILSPKYISGQNEILGSTKEIIERIATKKGNSERIYRNTILFLICSEIGFSKLENDVREYLSSQKINVDYHSQLEPEQRNELKRRLDEASKNIESSLVTAYSIVTKHSVKSGTSKLILKQYKESFENQINSNLITLLKDEEWLLESIGLNTLRTNNLLPSESLNVKAKDVYEAFVRYDDKPMITGIDAVSKSIAKYCYNGEYCIATGDGINFTKYFYQENVPFFDVNDATYWLVDKNLKPKPQEVKTDNTTTVIPKDITNPVNEPEAPSIVSTPGSEVHAPRKIQSISISGKVPLEQYSQLFSSFIMPLAQNNIEIEIKIKGKSTALKPLTESSQEYKVVKESARQLGLDFSEE